MMRVLRGQSIVEITVAAALISIAIIAALSLANYSQKQTTYAKDLTQATGFNSQAADWLRKEKGTLGFATIASKATTDASGNTAVYCLNTIPDEGSGDFTTLPAGTCDPADVIAGTIYQRSLSVDTSNTNIGQLKITSTVSWQDQIVHTTSIEVELSQWE